MQIDVNGLSTLQERLDRHPVYDAVREIEDLRCFMEHHVYSVWDFMSLIKFLQAEVAPTRVPWMPGSDSDLRYFINQLVLEEESDQAPPGPGAPRYLSHFELYCGAMNEIGASPEGIASFLEAIADRGLRDALESERVPQAAQRFTSTTFDFIETGQPHVVASALALGRERIIPNMFRAFLANMGIGEHQAPRFHYYLNRHIHLDEDFHGPLSLRLVERLCDGDPRRVREAQDAAATALESRIAFWDGVYEALQARAAAA